MYPQAGPLNICFLESFLDIIAQAADRFRPSAIKEERKKAARQDRLAKDLINFILLQIYGERTL